MRYLIHLKPTVELNDVDFIHGYDDPTLLAIDIAEKQPKKYKLYKKINSGFTDSWEPITVEELRKEVK